MTDTIQLHKDLRHLLTDLAQTLDDDDMDIARFRSIFARVIAEQLSELTLVVEAEKPAGAVFDPSQMSLFILPGQGGEE